MPPPLTAVEEEEEEKEEEEEEEEEVEEEEKEEEAKPEAKSSSSSPPQPPLSSANNRSNQQVKVGGWVDRWMDGWMDGVMGVEGGGSMDWPGRKPMLTRQGERQGVALFCRSCNRCFPFFFLNDPRGRAVGGRQVILSPPPCR